MPKKIIIADDEPHMRMLIELSLKNLGCELVAATDGGQVLALVAKELPSLIVMDVNMPVMDGLAALQTLKANPATSAVPVIMLTTRSQTLARENAEKLGAALFLTKPFSPAMLAAAARQLAS